MFLWKRCFKNETKIFKRKKDNLFAVNQGDVLLSSQFISEKRSSTFKPERNKFVSPANMTGFSFPRKLRRAMGLRWIPGAHETRYPLSVV